jgi:hypothetical protein
VVASAAGLQVAIRSLLHRYTSGVNISASSQLGHV